MQPRGKCGAPTGPLRLYAGLMLGLRARWGEVAGRDAESTSAPAPGLDAFHGRTEVLDTLVAGSRTDPAATTQVLGPGPTIERWPEGGTGQAMPAARCRPEAGRPARPARSPGQPPGRRRDRDVHGRCAGPRVGHRGGGPRLDRLGARRAGVFASLATVALICAGLFVRLPWSRPLSDERRRAVSALLVTGSAGAATALAVAPALGDGVLSAGAGEAARAVGMVLAILIANLVARTPVSESALLWALAWAVWVATPPGPGTWAALVGLGAAWAAAGFGAGWARGRRTALVLGSTLALLASVGMAAGPWAVPTRVALATVVVLGLGGSCAVVRTTGSPSGPGPRPHLRRRSPETWWARPWPCSWVDSRPWRCRGSRCGLLAGTEPGPRLSPC